VPHATRAPAVTTAETASTYIPVHTVAALVQPQAGHRRTVAQPTSSRAQRLHTAHKHRWRGRPIPDDLIERPSVQKPVPPHLSLLTLSLTFLDIPCPFTTPHNGARPRCRQLVCPARRLFLHIRDRVLAGLRRAIPAQRSGLAAGRSRRNHRGGPGPGNGRYPSKVARWPVQCRGLQAQVCPLKLR
jgi:hypothetical protein